MEYLKITGGHAMNSLTKLQSASFLFLDRDGVINRRIPDGYVTCWEEFAFLPGVLEAIAHLSNRFSKVVVVTNQQGVGKGLMSLQELDHIHDSMVQEIGKSGGRVDAVFYCTDTTDTENNCRKPGVALGLSAKSRFPEIEFDMSVMVGDSASDMEFGRNLEMVNVFIGLDGEPPDCIHIDYQFESLKAFAEFCCD